MELPEPALEKLARRPEPAMPLVHLRRYLDGPFPGPGEAIRSASRRPDLLRIVEVWRGPWRSLGPDPATLPQEVRAELERLGITSATWLVPMGPADPRGGGNAIRRMRETLRYLGQVVDVDSPRAVTRWIRIMQEGALVDPPDP
jgi:hypothetical protein